MRNAILLLFVILIAAGCEKGKVSHGNNTNPIYDTPVNFVLEGVHDVVMQQTDTIEAMVELKYLSGMKEAVSLGVNNLVDGFVISFTPALDTPSYFSTIRIITQHPDTGVRSFQIVAASSKQTKPYNINITVTPDPYNAATKLVGDYRETGNCTIDNPNHPAIVSMVPNTFNKISIKGFWQNNYAYTVTANIDESSKTVVIPAQVHGDFSFSGAGTYDEDKMIIDYRVLGIFVADTCSVVFTRQ